MGLDDQFEVSVEKLSLLASDDREAIKRIQIEWSEIFNAEPEHID